MPPVGLPIYRYVVRSVAGLLRLYGYDVTATDLAGKPSAPVSITGTAGL